MSELLNDINKLNKINTPQNNIPYSFGDVPVELIQYFDINVNAMDNRIKGQLKDIFEHCATNSKDMKDVLLRIRKIDRKLGMPSGMESRYGRIWSHIKLSSKIHNIMKKK